MGTKRFFQAAILGLLVFSTSCNSPDEISRRFTVRLLTNLAGSGRWEQAAEEGLERIADELDADTDLVMVGDAADRRARLGDQGRDGINLVFCVGSGFGKMLYSEASAFPETVFVLIPGNAHASNIGGIQFLPEEAGYLAGAAAGAIAPSDHVGLLRGAGRPWLEELERGFVAGFRARRGDAIVEIADGVEGVWRLRSSGAGIALYASDFADAGVLAATHDAGLLLVATNPKLMESEPDLVVAAVEVDVAEAMLRVAREVRDGTFSGRVFSFDLGSGVIDVILNPTMELEARRTARGALEHARSEVTAGWVELEEMGL